MNNLSFAELSAPGLQAAPRDTEPLGDFSDLKSPARDRFDRLYFNLSVYRLLLISISGKIILHSLAVPK